MKPKAKIHLFIYILEFKVQHVVSRQKLLGSGYLSRKNINVGLYYGDKLLNSVLGPTSEPSGQVTTVTPILVFVAILISCLKCDIGV